MGISKNLHIKCRPDSIRTLWNCRVNIEMMTKGTEKKCPVNFKYIFFSRKRKDVTEEVVQSISKMGAAVPSQLQCDKEGMRGWM